jgi:predicted N-acetyltransferase YhbS
MAIRQWKPQPLRITAAQGIEEFRASSYVCTATWGSIAEADKMDLKKVRLKNQHPLRDGALSRLGWWGDRVVGNVTVLRVPVRLGSVVLETAGIAGVCADPRARKQGIASALMPEALKASKEAGLCFSLLFGIDNFYHRFGFVPAWADHEMRVKPEELPGSPRWKTRKAGKGDVPRMMEYYNRLYGGWDGSCVRDPAIFLRGKNNIFLVLRGPRTGDWAYAILRAVQWEDRDHLRLIEAAGTGADWPDAVLCETAHYARKVERDSVIIRMPVSHPVCRPLTFRNATGRTNYVRNGAAMGAVLDFAGLARTMAPEWCRRIGEAGLAVPREGLAIRFREEHYRWWPDRADGRAERLERAAARMDMEFNDALARLVMGHGEPEEIVRHYAMRVRPEALPIVRAIFPARSNAFSALDHF